MVVVGMVDVACVVLVVGVVVVDALVGRCCNTMIMDVLHMGICVKGFYFIWKTRKQCTNVSNVYHIDSSVLNSMSMWPKMFCPFHSFTLKARG